MHVMRFESQALPQGIAETLRARLRDEHAADPFSAMDARETVRRVRRVAEGLGLAATIYRGALDLGGAEVDHVWLDVGGRVVDAAYPLLAESFVVALRRWVADEEVTDELVALAAGAPVDQRVLGVFPETLRYLGVPVWGARVRGHG